MLNDPGVDGDFAQSEPFFRIVLQKLESSLSASDSSSKVGRGEREETVPCR